MSVIESVHCPAPRPPTDGEWAARFVRRSLHALLGERLVGKAGPELDAPVLTAYVIGETLHGHPDVLRLLWAEAATR